MPQMMAVEPSTQTVLGMDRRPNSHGHRRPRAYTWERRNNVDVWRGWRQVDRRRGIDGAGRHTGGRGGEPKRRLATFHKWRGDGQLARYARPDTGPSSGNHQEKQTGKQKQPLHTLKLGVHKPHVVQALQAPHSFAPWQISLSTFLRLARQSNTAPKMTKGTLSHWPTLRGK